MHALKMGVCVFTSKGRPALRTLTSASPSRVRMEGTAWTLLMAFFAVAYQVIQVMLAKAGGWNQVSLFNAESLYYCLAAGLDSSLG